VRESHWMRLRQDYFENECDDNGRLIVRSQYNIFFSSEKPVGNTENLNAWRQNKCLCRCSWQMVLVFIALISGIFSYLQIAQGIETEEAVQVGLNVLNDVSLSAWVVFAVYNLVVLIYYWRSCWNSLKSGCRTFCSMLCRCCRLSTNQVLETAFKRTWSRSGTEIYWEKNGSSGVNM